MSEDAAVVGLVGPDATASVGDRLRDAGITVLETIQAIRMADPRLVIAVGDRGVSEMAAADLNVPIVPVGAGPGIRSVPRTAIDGLIAAIEAGAWTVERHRPLVVAVEGDVVGTAVFDVSLVTAQAASISEYSVTVDGRVLAGSRADGVVLATAAGSTEYARRIDGPVLSPGTGVLVAWIAPFNSNPDRWVVDATELTLRVEREESAVDLLVDERRVRPITPTETVTVRVGEPLQIAVVDASLDRVSS